MADTSAALRTGTPIGRGNIDAYPDRLYHRGLSKARSRRHCFFTPPSRRVYRPHVASPRAGILPSGNRGSHEEDRHVFAATGALLFSSKAIIVKLAYRHGVDALTLLALRMLFSAPLFFAPFFAGMI